MTYSFIFREEATNDFIDGYAWYEEQRVGLGEMFEAAVFDKLSRVCENPLHYKITYKGYHEALIDKFPFLLVYTVDEDTNHIFVFAVFHTSRNPKSKLKRRVS